MLDIPSIKHYLGRGSGGGSQYNDSNYRLVQQYLMQSADDTLWTKKGYYVTRKNHFDSSHTLRCHADQHAHYGQKRLQHHLLTLSFLSVVETLILMMAWSIMQSTLSMVGHAWLALLPMPTTWVRAQLEYIRQTIMFAGMLSPSAALDQSLEQKSFTSVISRERLAYM